MWLSLLVAVLVLGCSDRGETTDTGRTPMILLAVDGLEWRVLAPLLERGELPTMASLIDEGVLGALETIEPTYSPIIWTSVATGKTPGEHGIEGFAYHDETDGVQRLFTTGHRRTKAFWNILSDYGQTVHCLGWWVTYPAEAIHGTMLSQTNTTAVFEAPERALWKGTLLQGVARQVHPPERSDLVMERLAQVESSLEQLAGETFSKPATGPSETAETGWRRTRWVFRSDTVYLRVALDLVESGEPFDLLAVYVGGPDVVAHRFWRYAFPGDFEHPPSTVEVASYGGLIDDYYRYLDRQIERLLDAAPRGVNVLVLSDHGMQPINTDRIFRESDPPRLSNSAHHREAPPGVLMAAGPQIARSKYLDRNRLFQRTELETLAGIYDVLPTILALKGLPVGEDMKGAPLTGMIAEEWLRSHPIRHVASHDSRAWLESRRLSLDSAYDESERLEQLRALGYID